MTYLACQWLPPSLLLRINDGRPVGKRSGRDGAGRKVVAAKCLMFVGDQKWSVTGPWPRGQHMMGRLSMKQGPGVFLPTFSKDDEPFRTPHRQLSKLAEHRAGGRRVKTVEKKGKKAWGQSSLGLDLTEI